MRSIPDHSQSADDKPAVRFGALIRELAGQAGYDLSGGSGGRSALGRDIGMSQSAASRMIDGKTLPMPHQLEQIARVLHVDVRTLLIAAGVISERAWPKDPLPDVLSSTDHRQLSPEEAADQWGITDPVTRSMLLGSIERAMRLQTEANVEARGVARGEAPRGG